MEHERHRGIELFRVMLMFGICLLHANTMCSHPSDLAINLLSPCVCGFVFISGWFGIKFSIGKFVRLICTGLYSGLVALAMIWLFFPEYLTCDIAGIKLIHRVLFVRWFLLAYLVVMLIAPWINAAFDVFSDQEIKLLLIPMSILMLWNWASEIPYVSMAIPLPSGFGVYTPWTLVLIYVFGRFCRRLGLTGVLYGGGLNTWWH